MASKPTTLSAPMFKRVRIESWDALLSQLRDLDDNWIFRGHQNANWVLSSALERCASMARAHDELMILDRFRRRAPVHLPSHLVPSDRDHFAWLALMQHYGAPTRLLDFTRSPYVALFFAFETRNPHEEDRALWAVHTERCQRCMITRLAEAYRLEKTSVKDQVILHPDRFITGFMSEPIRGILPAEPARFDARQTAQQAIFLVPGSVDHSFEENLTALTTGERLIMQLVIPDHVRRVAIEDLARMNVTAASLFPGLDGYARSMHSYLSLEALDRRALLSLLGSSELES